MSNWYGHNKQPRVDVDVNGVKRSWLYDTGECRTCINTSYYLKWFKKCLPRSVGPKLAAQNLRDASGNS